MFELVTMKDDVKIEPHNFGDAIETAVEKELNRKLANKVYHNHGLCIILYDILEIGDSLILPGDGAWEVFESSFVGLRPMRSLELHWKSLVKVDLQTEEFHLNFRSKLTQKRQYVEKRQKLHIWLEEFRLKI